MHTCPGKKPESIHGSPEEREEEERGQETPYHSEWARAHTTSLRIPINDIYD